MITGCAQFIKDEVSTKIRQGDFEAAHQILKQGLEKYPEDTGLKSALISTQSEAISRLVSQAIQQRMAGRFDDANKTLMRALAFDPKNERILTLQNDIVVQRRTDKILVDALGLINAKKKEGPAIPSVEMTEMSRSQKEFFLSAETIPNAIPRIDANNIAVVASTMVSGRLCLIMSQTGRPLMYDLLR